MAEFTFDGQRPNEEVVLYRHQHPWVLAKPGFLDVLLGLIVLGLILKFGFSGVVIWVSIVLVLVGVFYTSSRVFLYQNVMFIITNERIINIDQSSIFGRKVQETELSNIYNLSYNVKGVIRNLLNFGNIELTTEGDVNDRIVLKNMPAPHDVFETLSKYRKRAMDSLGQETKTILR